MQCNAVVAPTLCGLFTAAVTEGKPDQADTGQRLETSRPQRTVLGPMSTETACPSHHSHEVKCTHPSMNPEVIFGRTVEKGEHLKG